MLDFFNRLFDADSLSPHGICLLWRPELIWTHVLSDGIIAVAYYSIPLFLIYFVTKRRDVGFGWVFWCFAAFILACGTTHLMAIWTLWHPDYAAEALIKAATASASIATAGALVPLLPTALKIPSPTQLRLLNEELTLRIEERDAALSALRREMAERSWAEAMLRQSQKLEALGRLSAGVAHDFNNLLGVLVLNLDRLEREVDGRPRGMRARDNAVEATRRASHLVKQMLSYARQEPLDPRRIALGAFLTDWGALARDAAGPQRRLTLTWEETGLTTVADESALANALLNLVVNARDATCAGDLIAIRAERGLCPDRDGPYAIVSVADTGAGMTPDVQARAFDPFFTTKDAGKGSGLGLSQVFGFAQDSGGQVTIETAPGRGTTIRLFLPLETVSP